MDANARGAAAATRSALPLRALVSGHGHRHRADARKDADAVREAQGLAPRRRKERSSHDKQLILESVQARMTHIRGQPLFSRITDEKQRQKALRDGFEIYKACQSLGLTGAVGTICHKMG